MTVAGHAGSPSSRTCMVRSPTHEWGRGRGASYADSNLPAVLVMARIDRTSGRCGTLRYWYCRSRRTQEHQSAHSPNVEVDGRRRRTAPIPPSGREGDGKRGSRSGDIERHEPPIREGTAGRNSHANYDRCAGLEYACSDHGRDAVMGRARSDDSTVHTAMTSRHAPDPRHSEKSIQGEPGMQCQGSLHSGPDPCPQHWRFRSWSRRDDRRPSRGRRGTSPCPR